jgi:hypothetical protein
MNTFLLDNKIVRRVIEYVIQKGYECPTYVSVKDIDDAGRQMVLVITYKGGEEKRFYVYIEADNVYMESE